MWEGAWKKFSRERILELFSLEHDLAVLSFWLKFEHNLYDNMGIVAIRYRYYFFIFNLETHLYKVEGFSLSLPSAVFIVNIAKKLLLNYKILTVYIRSEADLSLNFVS
jgi:hypothetical protein